MSNNKNGSHKKGIMDIDLPDYVPSLPQDFTFRKTNMYQIPSFVNGISNNINTLNDSDNLYKLEKALGNILKNNAERVNAENDNAYSTKGSVISNKSIYINYHLTLNNEYFIKNLPDLVINPNSEDKYIDILNVVNRKKKQLANREHKKNKLKHNWQRNVFNNINSINGTGTFDIKLPDDKFSKESYDKMEKLKLKKINKFKENELAWQKMKADVYNRLKEEEHLLKQLEIEERRLKEMNELKERQLKEEMEREKEREQRQNQPKMVFKLLPAVKKENDEISNVKQEIKDDNKDKEEKEIIVESKKQEFWVTLKYTPKETTNPSI